MHTFAIVLGILLVANCSFFLLYLLRTEFRMRAVMRANGITGGLVHRPAAMTIIPTAHFIGVAVGVFLLWWGFA